MEKNPVSEKKFSLVSICKKLKRVFNRKITLSLSVVLLLLIFLIVLLVYESTSGIGIRNPYKSSDCYTAWVIDGNECIEGNFCNPHDSLFDTESACILELDSSSEDGSENENVYVDIEEDDSAEVNVEYIDVPTGYENPYYYLSEQDVVYNQLYISSGHYIFYDYINWLENNESTVIYDGNVVYTGDKLIENVVLSQNGEHYAFSARSLDVDEYGNYLTNLYLDRSIISQSYGDINMFSIANNGKTYFYKFDGCVYIHDEDSHSYVLSHSNVSNFLSDIDGENSLFFIRRFLTNENDYKWELYFNNDLWFSFDEYIWSFITTDDLSNYGVITVSTDGGEVLDTLYINDEEKFSSMSLDSLVMSSVSGDYAFYDNSEDQGYLNSEKIEGKVRAISANGNHILTYNDGNWYIDGDERNLDITEYGDSDVFEFSGSTLYIYRLVK